MQPTFEKVTIIKQDKLKQDQVVAWITVTDVDFTGDTLTTTTSGNCRHDSGETH